MRVNSSEAEALGVSIHERYGSWEKARQAARLDEEGVYVFTDDKGDDQSTWGADKDAD